MVIQRIKDPSCHPQFMNHLIKLFNVRILTFRALTHPYVFGLLSGANESKEDSVKWICSDQKVMKDRKATPTKKNIRCVLKPAVAGRNGAREILSQYPDSTRSQAVLQLPHTLQLEFFGQMLKLSKLVSVINKVGKDKTYRALAGC